METGTIARLVADRGFGFIVREGYDKDLFFHAKDVKDDGFNDLREGDTVTFEVTEGQKGPAAINVAKAEATASATDADDTASAE